jgi:glyceraldehyde 3-phosphate dehydrogenase
MTTIHAYTNDQNTQDAPHAKGDCAGPRRCSEHSAQQHRRRQGHRSGTAQPERQIDGSAQRVPTITGSLTEVTAVLNKKVTTEEVNAAMKAANKGKLWLY